MNWHDLLTTNRLNDPKFVENHHRPVYAQDMDRILYSQPFRRLANKTQVHPLHDNDHLHQRLIHSLEVASAGRSLGVEVGAWLADDLKVIGEKNVPALAGLVQTACMAHDIGNPPFGHSGEAAMGAWFAEKFDHPTGIFAALDTGERDEFIAFEGNAQGFRILTRTEMYRDQGGMRLAMGALGAFAKYPVSALVRRNAHTPYIGLKKFGLFRNDVDTFRTIATRLGLPEINAVNADGHVVGQWWRRHPLAFLMEAADDICYNIMDLEDAFLCGDVDFATAAHHLQGLMPPSNHGRDDRPKNGDTIALYRAMAIGGAIAACVEAFKANYTQIMNGEFSTPLVDASTLAANFADIKTTARNIIFKAKRKTELEVFGRNVLYRVLDGLMPLINDLYENQWDIDRLTGYSAQLAQALHFQVHPIFGPCDALHALTDFVSGMTDRYAVKVAEMVGR